LQPENEQIMADQINNELVSGGEYSLFRDDNLKRIRSAQYEALRAVNKELISGHPQKPVFNVDESMSVEDADSASEKLFVVKTMQEGRRPSQLGPCAI